MSKLGKFFSALTAIVKKPSRLNLVLEDNERWKEIVIRKYGFEEGLPRVNITDLLPGFSESVSPYSFLDGGSLITDLALLKGLARKCKDCIYLEIGTWRGESVANVASVAKECFTISLPDETLRAMGHTEGYISLHRFFSKDLPNVKHIQHDSRSFNYNSLEKKFDLVFVDGDHHHASVKKDSEAVLPFLNNESSFIVWHDYAFSPERVRWEVLAGILDGLPASEHRFLYQVSNTLCCIYTKMPLPSQMLTPDSQPSHFFDIRVEAKTK